MILDTFRSVLDHARSRALLSMLTALLCASLLIAALLRSQTPAQTAAWALRTVALPTWAENVDAAGQALSAWMVAIPAEVSGPIVAVVTYAAIGTVVNEGYNAYKDRVGFGATLFWVLLLLLAQISNASAGWMWVALGVFACVLIASVAAEGKYGWIKHVAAGTGVVLLMGPIMFVVVLSTLLVGYRGPSPYSD